MPWSPIGPETMIDVAGGGPRRADVDPLGDDADAGGVDEQPAAPLPVTTAGPAVDHLGVAGDQANARSAGRGPHRLGHPAEHRQLQALLEDEAGAESDRFRSRHRDVVDGAVDRQVADAAAGEEQRSDHVGVGGEGQTSATGVVEHELGRIEQLLGLAGVGAVGAIRRPERREEQVLDQLGRQATAATVAEHDPVVVPQRQRARPVARIGQGGAAIGDRHGVSQRRPRPAPRRAGGTGGRRRRPPRSTPSSPRAGCVGCTWCRTPHTRSA